jgi:hypothetical protein
MEIQVFGKTGAFQSILSAERSLRSSPFRNAVACVAERIGKTSCWLLCVTALTAGCTTVEVGQTRKAATGIAAGEGITLMLDYRGGSLEKAHEEEDAIGACLTEALQEKGVQARFIYPDTFRSTAFPGMDIDAAPRRVESILLLLGTPEFRARIAPLGLRYLVLIGEDARSSYVGTVDNESARLGLYLGTFVMGKAYDRALTANIVDLGHSALAGQVAVHGKGASAYGIALFIIPVIVPSTVESRACKEFGHKIAEFLSGSDERSQPKSGTPER